MDLLNVRESCNACSVKEEAGGHSSKENRYEA